MNILLKLLFFLAVLSESIALNIRNGDMIQLKTLGRYIRVDPGQSQNSKLMIDTPFAWFHGSTFKLTIIAGNQWQLRSLTGKFVSAENGGGAGIFANRDSASAWESFVVQWVNDYQVQLKSYLGGWVGANANSQYAALISTAQKPNTWETFDVIKVPPIRGVNLGSWFVPENWMVDLYQGSGAGSLCEFVKNIGQNGAETAMVQHLSKWITESDFSWLATQGINSVRIPLGYWNVITDPYIKFVPKDPNTSFRYIDQAFDWAAKYGMTVLLDLHGGPGSQQGADHSGCSGTVGWNTQQNYDLSLQAISSMIQRYSSRSNLYGIELLNEPGWDLEQNFHTQLSSYYQAAYWEIRKHSQTAVVVLNSMYRNFRDNWNNEMTENQGYYSVLTDMHLYDCFGDQVHVSTGTHIDDAYKWGNEIAGNMIFKPTFSGEWSLATGDSPGGQGFADGELWSFSNGIGWYFWNYKLADDKNNNVWSFRTAITTGYRL